MYLTKTTTGKTTHRKRKITVTHMGQALVWYKDIDYSGDHPTVNDFWLTNLKTGRYESATTFKKLAYHFARRDPGYDSSPYTNQHGQTFRCSFAESCLIRRFPKLRYRDGFSESFLEDNRREFSWQVDGYEVIPFSTEETEEVSEYFKEFGQTVTKIEKRSGLYDFESELKFLWTRDIGNLLENKNPLEREGIYWGPYFVVETESYENMVFCRKEDLEAFKEFTTKKDATFSSDPFVYLGGVRCQRLSVSEKDNYYTWYNAPISPRKWHEVFGYQFADLRASGIGVPSKNAGYRTAKSILSLKDKTISLEDSLALLRRT